MAGRGGYELPASGGEGQQHHQQQQEDVPLGEHHGGSFRTYMRHKVARLHEQFHDLGAQAESRLFEGMVFFVNGHTPLPIEELRHLVVRHGGQIDQYESSRVTHVLCTHLPHAKLRQLQAQKLAKGAHQQTPILHPDFVTDCIQEGRRLAHAPYLIAGLRERHGRSIQGFLGKAPAASSLSSSSSAAAAATAAADAPPPLPAAAAAGGGTELAFDDEEEDDNVMEGMWMDDGHDQRQLQDEQEDRKPPAAPAAPASPPAAAAARGSDGARTSTSGSGSGSGGGSGSRRGRGMLSTKDDPDFIARYYETSRLHWIGSFRAKLMQQLGERAARKWRAAGGDTRPPGLVLHVDLDCFFVSALVRDRPELRGRPLAVAHAERMDTAAESSSEISSCNYPARAKGVRAGMFLREARKLCPELTLLKYDFARYEEVSAAVYEIFFEEAAVVQPVSCDEAFLELASPGAGGGGNGEEEGSDGGHAAAARIRRRILEATGCPASAGVSSNMLLARLATKRAKPDGQYVLPKAEALAYLAPLAVTELPSVGWRLGQELARRGVATCGDLREHRRGQLQAWFGEKTGGMLYDACRGVDRRRVAPDLRGPRSLGAEVNWGVRFSQEDQVEAFVGKLAAEVESRLAAAGLRGRQVTFKLKRSQYGPNEPEKLLGCGRCDNLSRSLGLPRATASAAEIAAAALQLMRPLRVPANLVRGLGIQMSRLEPAAAGGGAGGTGGGGSSSTIEAWVTRRRRRDQDEEEEEEEEEDAVMVVESATAADGTIAADAHADADADAAAAAVAARWEPLTPSPTPPRPQRRKRAADDVDGKVEVEEVMAISPGGYALPPASQVDASVLRELPAELRAHFEGYYRGEGKQEGGHQQPPQQQQPRRQRSPAAAAIEIDDGEGGGDEDEAEDEAADREAREQSADHWGMTMTQMDPMVFRALPPELQDEVRASVRFAAASFSSSDAGGGKGKGKGKRRRQVRLDAYSGAALRQVEGLDPEALQALPLHVRLEVLDHYHNGQRGPAGSAGAMLPPPPLPPPAAGTTTRRRRAGAGAAAAAGGGAASPASSSSSPASSRHSSPAAGLSPMARQRNQRQPLQLQQRGDASPAMLWTAELEVEVEVGDARDLVDKEEGEEGKGNDDEVAIVPGGRPRLFVEEGLPEVRLALARWLRAVDAEGPPAPPHLQLLAVFLLERVDAGEEQEAWALMRAFKRFVEETEKEEGMPSSTSTSDAWRGGYKAVLRALERRLGEREGDGPRVRWAGLQLG